MTKRNEDLGVSSPAFPLRVELANYQRAGDPGHPDTPLTRDDLEKQCGERITLARVTLDDADKRRASVFITAILTRGGITIEMNQDQTAFGGDMNTPSKVVSKRFKLRFFKGMYHKEP